jgi:hypothetical protein
MKMGGNLGTVGWNIYNIEGHSPLRNYDIGLFIGLCCENITRFVADLYIPERNSTGPFSGKISTDFLADLYIPERYTLVFAVDTLVFAVEISVDLSRISIHSQMLLHWFCCGNIRFLADLYIPKCYSVEVFLAVVPRENPGYNRSSASPCVSKRRLNGAVLRMRPEKPRPRVAVGVAR